MQMRSGDYGQCCPERPLNHRQDIPFSVIQERKPCLFLVEFTWVFERKYDSTLVAEFKCEQGLAEEFWAAMFASFTPIIVFTHGIKMP